MRAIYGVSSSLPKSKWYDAFGDPRVPNHNLFSARDRGVHAAMRRRVAGMYSLSTVKSYEPYVDNCVKLLLEVFDGFAKRGEVFDLQTWMQCYAFDVVGEITVGFAVAASFPLLSPSLCCLEPLWPLGNVEEMYVTNFRDSLASAWVSSRVVVKTSGASCAHSNTAMRSRLSQA